MGSKLTLTFSFDCLATHLPLPNRKQEDLCALPAVLQGAPCSTPATHLLIEACILCWQYPGQAAIVGSPQEEDVLPLLKAQPPTQLCHGGRILAKVWRRVAPQGGLHRRHACA